MNRNSKEYRAAMRAAFTPKESTRDQRSSEAGEVFTYERAGALYAIGFRGTAGRSEFHYRFRSAEQREEHIAKFFASIAAHAERIHKRREEIASYQHDVKPGDIFRSSWGYDQTNTDYYQVVALVGQHFAEVREICQQSQETGFMSGDCVPAPGQWATEADYSDAGKAYHAQHGHYPRKAKAPFRVKIQRGYQGEPCIKVRSFAHATRIKPVAEIAGAKVYGASHWTAYA